MAETRRWIDEESVVGWQSLLLQVVQSFTEEITDQTTRWKRDEEEKGKGGDRRAVKGIVVRENCPFVTSSLAAVSDYKERSGDFTAQYGLKLLHHGVLEPSKPSPTELRKSRIITRNFSTCVLVIRTCVPCAVSVFVVSFRSVLRGFPRSADLPKGVKDQVLGEKCRGLWGPHCGGEDQDEQLIVEGDNGRLVCE
ncbi:uncharacterized protein V6R79_018383 [Siganus canaliculatus]